MPGGRPPKLAGLEDEIIAAYVAGASVGELKRKYGTSNRPILRILDRGGIARPWGRPPALTPERMAEVVELYRGDSATWSLTRLERDFGVGRPAIRRALTLAGVSIDSTPGARPRSAPRESPTMP